MVILFGHMSKCERLPREVALEDVWMALDMLPSFRWRWERKDLKGSHPLIARLAEEVLKVNLHQVAPTTAPMLLSEEDWDTEGVLSPKTGNGGLQQVGPQPVTPTIGPAPYAMYGPPNGGGGGGGGTASVKNSPGKGNKNSLPPASQPTDKKLELAEVPAVLFYPFYPESQNHAGGNPAAPDINQFFGSRQSVGTYGYQPSEGSFMLEEKDSSLTSAAAGVPMWIGSVSTYVPQAS